MSIKDSINNTLDKIGEVVNEHGNWLHDNFSKPVIEKVFEPIAAATPNDAPGIFGNIKDIIEIYHIADESKVLDMTNDVLLDEISEMVGVEAKDYDFSDDEQRDSDAMVSENGDKTENQAAGVSGVKMEESRIEDCTLKVSKQSTLPDDYIDIKKTELNNESLKSEIALERTPNDHGIVVDKNYDTVRNEANGDGIANDYSPFRENAKPSDIPEDINKTELCEDEKKDDPSTEMSEDSKPADLAKQRPGESTMKNWNEMDRNERLEKLQEFENRNAEADGRQARTVEGKDYPDNGSEYINGHYDHENNPDTIYINNDYLDIPNRHSEGNAENTIAHEGRHATQHDVVDGTIDGEQAEIDDDLKQELKDDFENGGSPEDRTRPSERDAREYAAEKTPESNNAQEDMDFYEAEDEIDSEELNPNETEDLDFDDSETMNTHAETEPSSLSSEYSEVNQTPEQENAEELSENRGEDEKPEISEEYGEVKNEGTPDYDTLEAEGREKALDARAEALEKGDAYDNREAGATRFDAEQSRIERGASNEGKSSVSEEYDECKTDDSTTEGKADNTDSAETKVDNAEKLSESEEKGFI